MTTEPAAFADWASARTLSEHIAVLARALSTRSLGCESVPVQAALGRVLASDLRAPLSLPAFDNSQMDGFALASAQTPGRFTVEGMIPAGAGADASRSPSVSSPSSSLPRAVPIMTGAPVPPGADAVVPVEETEGFDAPSITVDAVEAGRFVRPAGSDIEAGETALPADTVLHPAALGLVSALGLTEVRVRRRPRVLLVTGGDEVVAPGGELRAGQIFDANTTLLRAVLAESGAQEAGSLTVDDTVDDFRTALARAVRECAPDLILTSGGISAGRFEVVRQAFAPGAQVGEGVTADEGIDAQVGFGSVAMQPGGPQGVGVVHAADAVIPVVCFPGNPVSTWTSAQLLLRRAFKDAWGVGRPLPQVQAMLTEDIPSLPGKTQVRRARLSQEGAQLQVRALPGTSSHLLARAVDANAFLLVPAGRGTIPAGEELTAVVLQEE
ncbi:gephyrin-like molybdotransferase Glp [Brevibacterium sp.]|uniref:molybdopterin molybdotransferase MoeA n=1 Tax=Brevibacterium sp. TaxID=1701 RepID=UPI0025BC63A3|nr:gephyrin-like molybdotransferase Glp [Brevibacterium sp.]